MLLYLRRALPSSLLLLSRAFTVTQPLESPSEDAPFESLKETISSLPNKVWHSMHSPVLLWDCTDPCIARVFCEYAFLTARPCFFPKRRPWVESALSHIRVGHLKPLFMQVIAEVSMEQDDDADYDRKLSQLRREEELINEEAKEAAAFLQTDIPVIRPGQVTVNNCVNKHVIPWPRPVLAMSYLSRFQ